MMSFTVSAIPSDPATPVAIVRGDSNNDGKMDTVSVTFGAPAGKVITLLGNGNDVFQSTCWMRH